MDRLAFEQCNIFSRNFSGKAHKYNALGNRTFKLSIPEDRVDELIELGANVKTFTAKDGTEVNHILVKVNDHSNIFFVENNSIIRLDKEEFCIVDSLDINYCDLVINLCGWEVNGATGKKAYLKKLYVNVFTDIFQEKYANHEKQQ